MKLVEFDLDAPEAPKALRMRFRSESRAITALYERCLGGFDDARGWKVLVECVPEVTRDDVRDLLGVLVFQVCFDPTKFEEIHGQEKKQMFLELLHSGVLSIADAEGWPRTPFEKAKQEVLDRKFVNEWWWQKPKWNRSRNLRGQLWCQHEMDAFRAWLVVANKAGEEIARRQVLETTPSEFDFVQKLGSTKWTRPDQFSLLAKDKRVVGRVDLL